MTAYFDRRSFQISEMERRFRLGDHFAFEFEQAPSGEESWHHSMMPIERWEAEMTRDVQLCASQPGFPPDLRDAIQIAIARYGSDPLECGTSFSCPDDQTECDTFRRLHSLCGFLHDIFHMVGRAAHEAEPGSDTSFLSDKPDTILNGRASRESDRRLALLREDPMWAGRLAQYDEWLVKMKAQDEER